MVLTWTRCCYASTMTALKAKGEALAKVWANIGIACCAMSVLCILIDGSSVGKVALRGMDVGMKVDSSVVKVALRLIRCLAVLATMGEGIVLI